MKAERSGSQVKYTVIDYSKFGETIKSERFVKLCDVPLFQESKKEKQPEVMPEILLESNSEINLDIQPETVFFESCGVSDVSNLDWDELGRLELYGVPGSIESASVRYTFKDVEYRLKRIESLLQKVNLDNLQSQDCSVTDPDEILDEYIDAVIDLEELLKDQKNGVKEETEYQYRELLRIYPQMFLWAFLQTCKTKKIKPNFIEFIYITEHTQNITAFKYSLRTIKGFPIDEKMREPVPKKFFKI